MRWGIPGAPIPRRLPFAKEITVACSFADVPPCLAYAIKMNETGLGTDPRVMEGGAVGDLLPSGDNAGHGIFQCTSSWPVDWDDPLANAVYALRVFIVPAITFWSANAQGRYQGDDLIRAVGASFNAGLTQAWNWHVKYGSVDGRYPDGTTPDAEGTPYGVRTLAHFRWLVTGAKP